ncbi:MAG TPA: hypothetical protein VN837_17925, partial [Chloroflexota bacterium]|nr:hypothetical protein [Chloroflexota bacterium]
MLDKIHLPGYCIAPHVGHGYAILGGERAISMFEARTNRYEDECAFLLAFVDDTEESPWMVAS